jgi:uncharacterized protein (TIGR03437 family)
MKLRSGTFLVAVWGFWPALPAQAQTVTFNFDTGAPPLFIGQNVPFDQAAGGITAHFSSPAGAAFSVQSDPSTGWHLSQFSGHYLYDNNLNRNVLAIHFSELLSAITFTFATADFQQVEVPTTLQLTAFLNSDTSPAIATVTGHGAYGSDTMPMGSLSFTSTAGPFNLVEIVIAPNQLLGAADFFIDNIVVTPSGRAGLLSTVCAASYLPGGPLAVAAIASGFSQGLSTGTQAATLQPLPLTLANTTVTVRDSAGVDHPAPLFYVSPSQINYLIPDGVASGPATITVTSGGQNTATGSLTIEPVAPGLFTANADGLGAPAAWAVAVAPDGTQTVHAVASCGTLAGSCLTAPISLGPAGTEVILELYGTGIRGRTSLAGVTATIAGVPAPVQYAGVQSQFAGLDQVNVAIPRSLAGSGESDLVLTVDGKPANTVRVNIQ